jgi:hypothetical protein
VTLSELIEALVTVGLPLWSAIILVFLAFVLGNALPPFFKRWYEHIFEGARERRNRAQGRKDENSRQYKQLQDALFNCYRDFRGIAKLDEERSRTAIVPRCYQGHNHLLHEIESLRTRLKLEMELQLRVEVTRMLNALEEATLFIGENYYALQSLQGGLMSRLKTLMEQESGENAQAAQVKLQEFAELEKSFARLTTAVEQVTDTTLAALRKKQENL